MTEGQPPAERRAVIPKDVFDRSNMPSRWERLTNVAPKIAEDRWCLAFVAARYLGEEDLPDPDTLVVPDELRQREQVGAVSMGVGWCAAALVFIGIVSGLPVLTAITAAIVVAVLIARAVVWLTTSAAVTGYLTLKARCEAAEARLDADPLHPDYRTILAEMIDRDEGTLAYCAAKIASEILRDPGWESDRLAIAQVDLCDELTEIAQSARQIAEDRTATRRLGGC